MHSTAQSRVSKVSKPIFQMVRYLQKRWSTAFITREENKAYHESRNWHMGLGMQGMWYMQSVTSGTRVWKKNETRQEGNGHKPAFKMHRRCTITRLHWGPVHCIKIAVFFQKSLKTRRFQGFSFTLPYHRISHGAVVPPYRSHRLLAKNPNYQNPGVYGCFSRVALLSDKPFTSTSMWTIRAFVWLRHWR